jgi:hypothetical protein
VEESVTLYVRDGGDGKDMQGKVLAVVSDRSCEGPAIDAYIPSSAQPSYRPASNVLKPVFRS